MLGDQLGGQAVADGEILRRTQVQNFDGSVRLQHDVIRADISVDQACGVNLLHGGGDAEKDGGRLLPGHGAVVRQAFLQRLAIGEVHDDIRRVVFLKGIADTGNLCNMIHLCHLLGFPDEGIDAASAQILCVGVFSPDQRGVQHAPADLAVGKVFLDGHPLIQHQIPADIGDAKTTLAKHSSNHVSSAENMIQRKRMLRIGLLFGVKAAQGAWIAFRAFHASKTLAEFHNVSPLSCFCRVSKGVWLPLRRTAAPDSVCALPQPEKRWPCCCFVKLRWGLFWAGGDAGQSVLQIFRSFCAS